MEKSTAWQEALGSRIKLVPLDTLLCWTCHGQSSRGRQYGSLFSMFFVVQNALMFQSEACFIAEHGEHRFVMFGSCCVLLAWYLMRFCSIPARLMAGSRPTLDLQKLCDTLWSSMEPERSCLYPSVWRRFVQCLARCGHSELEAAVNQVATTPLPPVLRVPSMAEKEVCTQKTEVLLNYEGQYFQVH